MAEPVTRCRLRGAMARKIEIELTSQRDDGTWTWRAAGAKQPKGVVDAAVLYPGAKVGDVVKADAEIDVDGITLTAVTAPAAKAEDDDPTRIRLVGQPRDFEPVMTTLVPKHERLRPERGPRREGD